MKSINEMLYNKKGNIKHPKIIQKEYKKNTKRKHVYKYGYTNISLQQ